MTAPTTDTVDRWADAACRGMDPEPWFSFSIVQIHYAFDICMGCDMRSECEAAGLSRENYGMWGGLTEWDRERVRKGRQPARCKGCERPMPRPLSGTNGVSRTWCTPECESDAHRQPCAGVGCTAKVTPGRTFCSRACVGRQWKGARRPRRVCASPGCDLTAAPHSTHCSPTCVLAHI